MTAKRKKKSDLLKEQVEAIRSELLELEELEEPTEEQVERARSLVGDFDTAQEAYNEQVAHEERVEAVRSAALVESSVERGSGPDVLTRSRSNPYEDLDRVRGANLNDRSAVGDLRSRALTAIDQAGEFITADQQDRAEKLVRGDRRGRIAQHILLTGSDEYQRAFESLLSNAGNPALLESDEYQAYKLAEAHRRAMTLTDSAGGFLVPFTLDPTIILTNAGSANPFRQVSTVKTITTDTWNGVSSAGVTAEWLAEASQVADASPTFAQPSITPKKAAAWVQGSFEVLADSGFGAEVGPLLADAKDRLEATAFTTGNGTTQPKGVITAVSAVGGSVVASATTDTYAVADVYAVEQALPPRHRLTGSPSWMANKAIINKTRQFDTSGGSSFWANLGMGQPEQLLGAPIYEASAMDGVINAGAENYSLLLGDFRNFYIVDRVGMTMVYEPLVKGANGRPTGEAGWFAYWRVGSDVVNADAFRLLNIT
ncbi:phage major capsid protein [Streptomyces caniscabiei]|uniref:Phage major capsid protein n=1 Tax=Streptomyces caniscabiei TaxID=2746961 RepID=A0ABU4MIL9_9ACTN|nr:phage major capsid protein [Streptomyces caniscabiei]MBE4790912.1 phage major capsid protein [Streptomyces caniscabiei]MDX2953340.1 phage major capsid protein [Streptomyces caniscabiei]MDX2987323.1 phage major capsid protein [Streptomyces caniscabiei]MDX3009540.1 phage major capsid protein [Streptomyces caniscabiei]MDX3037185.1 phage major capsid protein [Streptomyces caniscabiei]